MSEESEETSTGYAIGSYIKGQYVGKGAYGKVYRVQHKYVPEWARPRCIKEIACEQLSDDQESELLREGQILAKLEHRHIVRIHDLMVLDNKFYMIMDYAEGGSLAATLQNISQPLPLAEVDTIIEQIADGLHYLHHEHHIIHRDLKPHNILRHTNGEVVIADFGIAKILDEANTQATYSRFSTIGTPAYMAPEHFAGQATYSSDLYSLGVIAYQFLTRQLPFGKKESEAKEGHCKKTPPPLRDFNPRLTPEIEQVVLKMLAKKPEDRYSNAIEFARALHSAITKATFDALSATPDNLHKLLPRLLENQVISLEPGEYKGPFILEKSIRLIGSGSHSDGPHTKVFAIDEPVFHLRASGVTLENMLIQRTPTDELAIQADKDITYTLQHVTVQGKLAEGARWQGVEWQLPIDGIDLGRIPSESKQERKVAIEVKDECVVETDIPGLSVFPTRLTVGPHTLSLEYNAQGKLPGVLLNGYVTLRSETGRKTIAVTGQIEQPQAVIQREETPSVTEHVLPYHLQITAARSLLSELGSNEDKDHVNQWQREKDPRLKRQILNSASALLFDLFGPTAYIWYVKRTRSSSQSEQREEEKEETWELMLAIDKQAQPDIVAARKKTLRLIFVVPSKGHGKPRLTNIRFLAADKGTREENLSSLPVLLRLTISGKSDISQDLLQQIQQLPFDDEYEPDGDQIQDWESVLDLQRAQLQKQQYWVRYTSHDYRYGDSKVTFFLDKEDLLDSAMEPLSYQEFLERAHKTRKEPHMLFAALPDASSAKKRGQRGQKIGTLHQVDDSAATLTISLELPIAKKLEDGSERLLETGYLHYDAFGDMQQIDNQYNAILDLQQGNCYNPRLPDFFFHAYKAQRKPVTQHLQAADLLSGTCNSGQIAAIEAALASPDLLLLQGPPGTGKTTVIAEICYQVALRGGRTLIASQTNLAVDNALGRLIHKPSIRALRKGNPDSVEDEGRDFTEENVVEKWLKRTANDCQNRLERRQQNIALLETLLNDTEQFAHYYEAESKWENTQFTLQRRLEHIEREILRLTEQQAQQENKEQQYLRLQATFSALITGDTQLPTERLEEALQYMADVEDKNTFIECLQRSSRTATRVGLAVPSNNHLQDIMWLKRTVPASTSVWTESGQLLKQIYAGITALNAAHEDRNQLSASVQAKDTQLSDLASNIKTCWQALQSLEVETAPLQQPARFSQELARHIASTSQQAIHSWTKQPFADVNVPITLPPELFLKEELIASIRRDPSAQFISEWKATESTIDQYIQNTKANIHSYQQALNRLFASRQRFGQLLNMAPEIRQGIKYIPNNYAPQLPSITGFHRLLNQIDSHLRNIESSQTRTPAFLDRFFESRNRQQLLQSFQAISDLLAITASVEQILPQYIQHDISQFAQDTAQKLSDSLDNWIKQQTQALKHARSNTLTQKEQLTTKYKKTQQDQQDEKDQLAKAQECIQEQSMRLATLFQQLQQRADLPIALRQIAQNYTQPQAPFLTFSQKHGAAYQNWIDDIEQLEADVARLWRAITFARGNITIQQPGIHDELEQLKQTIHQFSTEQEGLNTQLRQGLTDIQNQRGWWEQLWQKTPAHLRPTEPAEGIYTLPFLATMRQQFRSWREELARERTFSRRFDGLITDWVTRLQTLTKNDRQELGDLYIKNANVIGITCGQVNKLNYAENKAISRFDVVIIDEVSKATPPEILLAALKGKKLILIGDQRQLPPMMDEKTLEQLAEENGKDRAAFRYLNRQYFEQRYNEAPEEVKRMLYIQYRMHPDIMAVINQFYHRPLECGLNQPDIQRDHQFDFALVRKHKHLIWVDTPLVPAQPQKRSSSIISARNRMSGQFIFTYQSEHSSFGEEGSGTSFVNYREVEIINKICEDLQRQWEPKVKEGFDAKEVGVITFYNAQRSLLQTKLVPNGRRGEKKFKDLNIRVGTVDRFQGMEKAVVIVSLVRNNRGGDIGFAKRDERINVAFSRAQELLIIVGCHDLFCVRARQEDAAERYSNVAKVVRKRGDFIDISNS